MDYIDIARKFVADIKNQEKGQSECVDGYELQCRMVKARIRGTDRFIKTFVADICWHCHGTLTCKCAGCGIVIPRGWREGQCGACLGAGYLTWGEVQ